MEENKLVKWFENYFANEINKEYLYLKEFNLSDDKSMKFNNATTINLENFKEHLSRKNYILYGSINDESKMYRISSATWIKKNDIKIISVECNEDLLNAIKSENIYEIGKFEYQFIEKIDFHKLLESENIKSFLEERDKDTSYFLENDILKLIQKDKLFNMEIELFNKHKILTAILANKIYRLCQLDFCSTTTDIGNKIRKILNSKSKSITSKKLREYFEGINIENKTSFVFKQTRVYDLNVNQIEFDTKIKIAKNLISLKKEKLDIKVISEVTELLEKDVLNIIKGMKFLYDNED